MKILIPYIATADYIGFLPRFLETLDKFLPKSEKLVCVATDHDESVVDDIFERCNCQKYKGSYLHILHQPWPLVALSKFIIIDHFARTHQCDYIFNFDASVEFRKEIPERLYLQGKMIGVLFYGWDQPEVNHNEHMLSECIENSHSFVNCRNYPYVCSGTMGGPVWDMLLMCEVINKWIRWDLKNKVIPPHDDESYFVRYFTELPESSKLLLPIEFDSAPDYDWFDSEFNKKLEKNAYIYSQDDSVIQKEKFCDDECIPLFPDELRVIPDQYKPSSRELFNSLKKKYKI